MFSKHYKKNFLLDNLLLEWAGTGDSTFLFSYNHWIEILQKDSLAMANAIADTVIHVGTNESHTTIDFDAGSSLQYSNSTQSFKSNTS